MEKNDRRGPDFPENRPPSESYRPYQPPVFPAGYPAYPSGAPSTARAEEEPSVPVGGPQYQPASNQQGQAPFSQAGCPPHPFGGGPAPHPNTGPSRSAPALQAGPAAPSGPAAPAPFVAGMGYGVFLSPIPAGPAALCPRAEKRPVSGGASALHPPQGHQGISGYPGGGPEAQNPGPACLGVVVWRFVHRDGFARRAGLVGPADGGHFLRYFRMVRQKRGDCAL